MQVIKIGHCEITEAKEAKAKDGSPYLASRILYLGGDCLVRNPKKFVGQFSACEVECQLGAEVRNFIKDGRAGSMVGTAIRLGAILAAQK